MFQGFLRRPLFSGSMLGLILLCFSWFVGYGLAVVTWWSSPAPHLQATLDGAYVHLSWRPPSGSHPTHYAVYRDGEYLAFSGPSGYTDMQASSGRVYVYSVAVIGGDHRQGQISNMVHILTPSALSTAVTPTPLPSPAPGPAPVPSAAALARTAAAAASAGGIILPQPSSSEFIVASGTGLLLKGKPFRFTGFDVYNATSLNKCGGMMGQGGELDDALNAWGITKNPVMRTWFFQSLATENGVRNWSSFDHTLAVAKAHGVHVVVTLGNQWGDCEDGVYKLAGWYGSGYKTASNGGTVAYRNWVAEVVARYRDDPTILAWQLMNEAETKTGRDQGCASGGAQTLRAFADDMGGLVHALDGNHMVSLGTIGGGQCGTQGDEYQYVHASPAINLCEYHDYGSPVAMPDDEWNGLTTRVTQCAALKKPLFVGEVGYVPNDIGGTLQARADLYKRKFAASFGAGIVGELVWSWANSGSSFDDYNVGPGDPALSVLRQ